MSQPLSVSELIRIQDHLNAAKFELADFVDNVMNDRDLSGVAEEILVWEHLLSVFEAWINHTDMPDYDLSRDLCLHFGWTHPPTEGLVLYLEACQDALSDLNDSL